jgi:hypothetical protein
MLQAPVLDTLSYIGQKLNAVAHRAANSTAGTARDTAITKGKRHPHQPLMLLPGVGDFSVRPLPTPTSPILI